MAAWSSDCLVAMEVVDEEADVAAGAVAGEGGLDVLRDRASNLRAAEGLDRQI